MSEIQNTKEDKELQNDHEEFGSNEIKSIAYVHMDFTLHTEYAKRVYKRIYKFMRHNANVGLSVPRRTRVAGAAAASKKIMDAERERLEETLRNDLELARHQIKEFGLTSKLDEMEIIGTEHYKAKYDTPYAKSILGMIKLLDDLAIALTLLYMDGLIEESRSIDHIFQVQQRFYKFSTFLHKHAMRVEEGAKQEMIARKRQAEKKQERYAKRKAERAGKAAKKEVVNA